MEVRYHAQFNRDLGRLGITQDGGVIILRRLLHRSEIYRNFP